LFADDRRTEPVGGSLQGRDIVDGEEGVIVLAETDSAFHEFPLDERMTVEPIGGVEREEGGHANDDGSQDLIPDIEVGMREAAALMRQDAVVGVLGGIFRHTDAECPTPCS